MQSKKNKPWWKKLLLQLKKNFRIVSGYDPDFGENIKIGFKTNAEF